MAVGLSRAGAHWRAASGPLSCGDLSWMHRPQTACLNFLQHSQGIQIWSGWGRRARLRSPAVAACRSPTQRAPAGRAGSGGRVWHQHCGFPVPALRGGRVQWEGGVRGHFGQFRGALLRDPPTPRPTRGLVRSGPSERERARLQGGERGAGRRGEAGTPGGERGLRGGARRGRGLAAAAAEAGPGAAGAAGRPGRPATAERRPRGRSLRYLPVGRDGGGGPARRGRGRGPVSGLPPLLTVAL